MKIAPLCIAAAMLVCMQGTGARPLAGIGNWSSNAELSYELERQDTQSENAPSRAYDSDRFREKLNIKNQGYYLLDPELATGNMGMTLEFLQEQDNFAGINGSQNGQLIGYNFDIRLLPSKPYTLLAYADRNQDSLHRDFGTRSDITNTNFGARFDLRNGNFLGKNGIPYFRTSLGVTHNHTVEDTRGPRQGFRRNEVRNELDYSAHKGFETADLDFNYRLEDVKDNALARSSFINQTANLTYSLDFGPNLNRRWDSHLGYLKRNGTTDTQFILVNENLHIAHFKNLSTNYRYSLTSYKTPNGTTLNQTGSASLQHRLYKNLITSIRGQGTKTDLPNGSRDSYQGSINMNYNRKLPEQGQVFVYGATRYQINNNNLDSSLVDVVDESHNAPAVLGAGSGFELNRPFPVTGTIEIVDNRGGSRLPVQEGIDYELLPQGENIQIIPIPTSPIIQPGDPLLISYSYEVSPSISYSTAYWSLGGGVNYRWLRFSVMHEDSNQSLLSGRDQTFLNDRRLDRVSLGLHGEWKQLQGRVNNTYQVENSTRLKYRRWQFDQYIAYTGPLNMTLSSSTSESLTRYDLPSSRDQENYSAHLSLDGWVHRIWLVRAFAGVRILHDTLVADEKIHEAGITSRGRIGKLTLQGIANWSEYDRGAVTTNDWRLEIRITRNF